MGEVLVLQAKMQSVTNVGDQLPIADRKQHSPEATGRNSINDISQSVKHQNPHTEKMPLQRPLLLATDGDPVRKVKTAEQHFVVVDFPSAPDHDDQRGGIRPMHDPQRQRMKPKPLM